MPECKPSPKFQRIIENKKENPGGFRCQCGRPNNHTGSCFNRPNVCRPTPIKDALFYPLLFTAWAGIGLLWSPVIVLGAVMAIPRLFKSRDCKCKQG